MEVEEDMVGMDMEKEAMEEAEVTAEAEVTGEAEVTAEAVNIYWRNYICWQILFILFLFLV